MIKYRATTFWSHVYPVEVVSENEENVMVKGDPHLRSKDDGFSSYHDTFDQAKLWLIAKIQLRLDEQNRNLDRVMAIEPPGRP